MGTPRLKLTSISWAPLTPSPSPTLGPTAVGRGEQIIRKWDAEDFGNTVEPRFESALWFNSEVSR
jgi:hypothetical protein